MGLHHLDGHDHGGLLRVSRPALGKAWSEHARDPLSFPLGRVGAAVQPGAQFRQTNAEGLGGSPAAPPTAFELRAQPCSDGAFEVPAVDLVENRLDAFFTRLHIHPSAHDHSVLNLATMQRQANVDSRGETGVRRSAGSMSLGADRPCSAFPAVRVGSRCATSAAANWQEPVPAAARFRAGLAVVPTSIIDGPARSVERRSSRRVDGDEGFRNPDLPQRPAWGGHYPPAGGGSSCHSTSSRS